MHNTKYILKTGLLLQTKNACSFVITSLRCPQILFSQIKSIFKTTKTKLRGQTSETKQLGNNDSRTNITTGILICVLRSSVSSVMQIWSCVWQNSFLNGSVWVKSLFCHGKAQHISIISPFFVYLLYIDYAIFSPDINPPPLSPTHIHTWNRSSDAIYSLDINSPTREIDLCMLSAVQTQTLSYI